MKVITIGRSSDNNVTIQDASVSRHHCQIIQHDNGQFTLSDFGSTNGTFVNGHRIHGEVPLNPNDIVKIGNAPLQWRNYFDNAAPIPRTSFVEPMQRAMPQSAPRSSSTKALPILLGVLGVIAVGVIVVVVFMFSQNNQGSGSGMSQQETNVPADELSQNITPTINEQNQDNVNTTDITGKWEWVSEEAYEVLLNDEEEKYGMSRIGFQLELKDDGTNISGTYWGGYFEDALGDPTDAGILSGTWDGEKYVVKLKSKYYEGYSCKATIRPLSAQKIDFKLITDNSWLPDHEKLNKVKRFSRE